MSEADMAPFNPYSAQPKFARGRVITGGPLSRNSPPGQPARAVYPESARAASIYQSDSATQAEDAALDDFGK